MSIPLSYNWRSLWVRRATTLATAAGIALVVFVLASSLMLARGVQKTLLNAGENDRALVLDHDAYSEDGSRLNRTLVGLVAAAPGVKKSQDGVPLVVGETVLQLPFSKVGKVDQVFSVQLRGVTASSFRLRPVVRIVAGRLPKPNTNEAMVGRGVADQYVGTNLGGGFDLGKNIRLEIVGVFEAEGTALESEIWSDLDVLRAALGWEGHVSSITAQLSSERAFDAFALTLESDKRQGLSVFRERAYYEKMSRNLADGIQGLGRLVTVIFALAALLGSSITMYAAVGQRRREIGVLRALGFTPAQVLTSFLLESLALALLGSGLGVLLALVTPFLDFTTTNVANGQSVAFRFAPSLEILLGALAAGTLVGVLGGFFPALRAARVSPVRAMRG
jgi:putative ABC transport system permease protein